MFLKRLATLSFLLFVPSMAACDQPGDDLGDDETVSGKADQLEGDDASAAACPADVYVTHAANDVNNHIFSNCHNAATGKFVARSCCEEAIDFIEDVSGCPAQVKFTETSDPSDKRCVNDVAGHDGKGQFVKTACCAALCDDNAAYDDYGYCRAGNGTFEEEICCIRNLNLAAANCIGAEWEAVEGGTVDFVCRADNGQFALNACCADQCAETISRTGQVPEGCNLDDLVANECPDDATPNAGGICHNPENGQFVKAACCAVNNNKEGLDIDKSDECWAGMQSQQACI